MQNRSTSGAEPTSTAASQPHQTNKLWPTLIASDSMCSRGPADGTGQAAGCVCASGSGQHVAVGLVDALVKQEHAVTLAHALQLHSRKERAIRAGGLTANKPDCCLRLLAVAATACCCCCHRCQASVDLQRQQYSPKAPPYLAHIVAQLLHHPGLGAHLVLQKVLGLQAGSSRQASRAGQRAGRQQRRGKRASASASANPVLPTQAFRP